MKYIITGAAGNISRPLAEKLIRQGHEVSVISRNADHIRVLIDLGAKAAIGSVEDTAFLEKAFAGMDAVYTMTPPKNDITARWKEYIGGIGVNFAAAIRSSGIRYVVNLSSVGAHLPDGCGPVSGLYRVEQALNALQDVNVLHLRPGYFYFNFFGMIDMIRNMNIMGSNFGGPGFVMMLAHPADIAEAAFDALNTLSFSGKSVLYVSSEDRTTDDIARVLGESVGKPALPWVAFTDEQALGGLLQAGLPEELARNYVEMGQAIQSGIFLEDYKKQKNFYRGKIKLEDFAKTFTMVYNQKNNLSN